MAVSTVSIPVSVSVSASVISDDVVFPTDSGVFWFAHPPASPKQTNANNNNKNLTEKTFLSTTTHLPYIKL